MLGRFIGIVLLTALAMAAARGDAAPYLGRAVGDVIDEFLAAGYRFAYSDALVTDDLRVTVEPQATDPAGIVRQILAPHALTLRYEAGTYLVVRAEPGDAAGDTAVPDPTVAPPKVENIVVSASRYEIARDNAVSHFRLDRRTIQTLPDVGEDPLRATQRLPGAAAGGVSAKTHFRGGEDSEIGIVLNGQRLFDPYHVRDYQSIFSVVDARAIEGVEVFTGGFPARYGDRMSGFVLMESMQAEQPRHSEIGVSVFNTSLLSSGSRAGKRWLVSARRGNLDLVIDPQYGRPKYYDVFGEFSVELSPNATLSVNALYADDVVSVVLETDPAEREEVESKTRNAQVWVQLDNHWSDEVSMSTVLSTVTFDNSRVGLFHDFENLVADVRDVRDIRQFGLRQDWTWSAGERHRVQWGVQLVHSEAQYDYVSSAEYYGLPALYPQLPDRIDRSSQVSPQGGSYGAYFSDRWKLAAGSALELGLRWDDQTYTGLASDSQLSPRISVLQKLGANTDLRLSWGRYHQSQGIHELQVEDGVTSFQPAQRADHLIAGIQHRLSGSARLRLEFFQKDMHDVRPRFENLFNPLGLIPELQPDRVRLVPSAARSRGAEISIDASRDDWYWWTSYTWSRATDTIDGRDEERSWDQRHALQGGLGWSEEAWDFSVAASVHSGWPATDLALQQDGVDADGEPVYVAVPGPRNALRHNAFASLDARVSRRFELRRGTLSLFVEVSNLTNRKNSCCVDWDLLDTAAGGLELEKSLDYWLPLLPAVGVLWEF